MIAMLAFLVAPPDDAWEPDPAEVTALAQCLYGECRGYSEIQQKAVCWCIFNRVDDDRFPDTVLGVITQRNQFAGYSPDNPVWDSLYAVAYDCLTDWHNGEGRVFGADMCWFSGWAGKNHFRNAYLLADATKLWEEQ